MRKKIVNCLNHDMITLYKKTAALQALESTIKKSLPVHIKDTVTVSSYDKGLLILACTNPATTTELRFLIPTLRTSLRSKASLYALKSIKLINAF